jgi:hypothetical protein
MNSDVLSGLIGVLGGLLGGLLAGIITIWAERRRYRIERTKLLALTSSAAQVEAARISAYQELWSCLEGISTYRPGEIAQNLRSVQDKLNRWYYASGGGLLISGSADEEGSTKAAFFAARDLRSSNVRAIWEAFHHLRRCLRRDRRIFEDEAEEQTALKQTKRRLAELEA